MDLLPRTAVTLEDCKAHIATIRSTGTIDTSAVEAYLARHVVLVLCAEIEQSITDLVYQRVDRGGCDPVVANLMRARKKGMVRSANHDEIASTLGQLDISIRDSYKSTVLDAVGEAGVVRLGNAVTARDSVSHASPPSITLNDVEAAYQVGLVVVDAATQALAAS